MPNATTKNDNESSWSLHASHQQWTGFVNGEFECWGSVRMHRILYNWGWGWGCTDASKDALRSTKQARNESERQQSSYKIFTLNHYAWRALQESISDLVNRPHSSNKDFELADEINWSRAFACNTSRASAGSQSSQHYFAAEHSKRRLDVCDSTTWANSVV